MDSAINMDSSTYLIEVIQCCLRRTQDRDQETSFEPGILESDGAVKLADFFIFPVLHKDVIKAENDKSNARLSLMTR